MKTAQYNNGIEVLTLSVIAENKDGTLELGNEAGELKVGKCPVSKSSDSDKPEVGSARIVVVEAASPNEPAKPGTPTPNSDAGDGEDTDAAAAAVKGKGKK